nr:unnamed protein product [Digitaria exilis]
MGGSTGATAERRLSRRYRKGALPRGASTAEGGRHGSSLVGWASHCREVAAGELVTPRELVGTGTTMRHGGAVAADPLYSLWMFWIEEEWMEKNGSMLHWKFYQRRAVDE